MASPGRATAGAGQLTPTGRVPVEHRVFGLDRRTLLPGLVVIGLFVLWTVVVPAIDDALSYDQQTRAGDVFRLRAGLTMDAQPGWGVQSGLRTTDEPRGVPDAPVGLTKGGVSFTVTPGTFRGDARELLGRVEKLDDAIGGEKAFHVAGDVGTFHTNQGRRGFAQAYTTVTGAGVISTLVYEGTGLNIRFTGSSAGMADRADEVGKMIDSIRYDAAAR